MHQDGRHVVRPTLNRQCLGVNFLSLITSRQCTLLVRPKGCDYIGRAYDVPAIELDEALDVLGWLLMHG